MQLVTKKEKAFLKINANTSTPTTLGTIVTANKAETQAASVAATVGALVTDFNALLAKLKAAGIVL